MSTCEWLLLLPHDSERPLLLALPKHFRYSQWNELGGQPQIPVQIVWLFGRYCHAAQIGGGKGAVRGRLSRAEQFARAGAGLWHQPSDGPQLGKKKARQVGELAATLVKPKRRDILELDELWSFVFCKKQVRWIWIALCRRTRQVVAYLVGDRSEASCRAFWKRIPAGYKRSITYSDYWRTYEKVIQTGRHYSVGKESGQTNHVERWNNTLRQRISRFVRKTLSFSKSDEMHELVLKLFLVNYNKSLAS